MRRPLTQRSKVAGAADQRTARSSSPQTRLTITLAVNGFSRLTSASASSSRPLPCVQTAVGDSRAQHAEKASRNGFAQSLHVATNKHVEVSGLHIANDVHSPQPGFFAWPPLPAALADRRAIEHLHAGENTRQRVVVLRLDGIVLM